MTTIRTVLLAAVTAGTLSACGEEDAWLWQPFYDNAGMITAAAMSSPSGSSSSGYSQPSIQPMQSDSQTISPDNSSTRTYDDLTDRCPRNDARDELGRCIYGVK